STPPTASPRRKPVPSPIQNLSAARGSVDEDDHHRPSPTAPVAQGAISREGPTSPMSLGHRNKASSSPPSAGFEPTPSPSTPPVLQLQDIDDRALPKSPEGPPPPPPPHRTPPNVEARGWDFEQNGDGPPISVRKPPSPPRHAASHSLAREEPSRR